MAVYLNERRQTFELQAIPHRDSLYRFGLRLTGNPTDADDLVQETYLKAFRFWDTYDQGTNIRAWLYRILKNSFINTYRKESKEPTMVDYSEVVNLTSARHPVAFASHQQDLGFNNLLDDDVSGAVSGLPENFRTIVILRDIEGLSYEEIARFVDCPLGTVRSRLHRGRRLLHSTLHDYAMERGYGRSVQSSVGSLQCAMGK